MDRFTEEITIRITSDFLDYLVREGYLVARSSERKAELIGDYLDFLEDRRLDEVLAQEGEK